MEIPTLRPRHPRKGLGLSIGLEGGNYDDENDYEHENETRVREGLYQTLRKTSAAASK